MHLLIFLFSAFTFSFADAVSCGGPLTSDCLGDSDIRYDPDVSNAAVDQAPIWKKYQGYFIGSGDFQVIPEGGTELSAPLEMIVFTNITLSGSRLYLHRIQINPLFSQILLGDTWATTTYEKDGTMEILGVKSGNNFTSFESKVDDYFIYPVDKNSIFATSSTDGLSRADVVTESYVFLDGDEGNVIRGVSELFDVNDNEYTVLFQSGVVFTRTTKEEWVEAVNKAYVNYSIPEGEQGTVPFTNTMSCFSGGCPTEEDFCDQDPDCSVSIYQEPDASVNGGAIAGFAILCIAVLLVLLYGVHRYLQAQQAKRYRTVFAKRIADTISVRKSMRSLSPEAMAAEFKKIDSETPDGRISKKELWNFLSSGKAGELSESDFNALFAVIDADDNGYVDFVEFCAFLAKCHDEFRAAHADRGSIMERSSRRMSVVESAARRMSSMGAIAEDMKELEVMENGSDDSPTKNDAGP